MSDICDAHLDREQIAYLTPGTGQVRVILSPSHIEAPRVLLSCDFTTEEERQRAFLRTSAFMDGFQAAQSIAREP